MPVNVSVHLGKLIHRLRHTRLPLAATIAVALIAPATSAASPVVPSRPVSSATVTTNLVRAVPQSFLGVSMDVEQMESFDEKPAFLNYLNLLNTNQNGNGPFVLRLGGTYIDSSYWGNDQSLVAPAYQANPSIAVYLNQAWMDSLNSLVQATGSKVILNVNAQAHSPQMAADFVRAAQDTLPAGSLMAVPIGNEPDLWDNSVIDVARNQAWARGVTPDTYAAIFASYARVLREQFPGLTLAGPDIGFDHPDWFSTLLQRDPGEVGLLASHLYPLSACASPGAPTYPTVFKYLQNSLWQDTTADLQPMIDIAENADIPFRLTEFDSATCGGTLGVSNTFVTSLWMINQLFSLMQAGVSGVNLHLNPTLANAMILQTSSSATGLEPRPSLYGMAAFNSALQPDDVLTQVSGSIQPNVSVWALHGSEGWSLALVNSSATSQLVDVSIPASGQMTVTPLTASSPSSTTATFGGQTISDDGEWSGTPDVTDVQPSSGVYPIVLPPTSAAIAHVAAAPGVTITAAIKHRAAVKKHRKKTSKKAAKRKAADRKRSSKKKPERARSRKSGRRRHADAHRRR